MEKTVISWKDRKALKIRKHLHRQKLELSRAPRDFKEHQPKAFFRELKSLLRSCSSAPVMSLFNATSNFTRNDAPGLRLFRKSESSDDEEKRLKRREKNRVAAQRSRKRQTQRADELHEAYECLEQENSLLRKEVQILIEEQQRLTDALKAHEPLCPILNCGMTSTSRSIGTVSPEFMSR